MTLQPQSTPASKRSMLNTLRRRVVYACLLATAVWGAVDAFAQPVECTGQLGTVTAIADVPGGHQILTRFQADNPPLQPLLSTTIQTHGRCLVAHVSGLTRVTDNYVVFQVSVDGVPMVGGQNLTGLPLPGLDTPVTSVSIDALSAAPLNDEQFIDPTKVSSFIFFTPVRPGTHTVTLSAAAGSGVDTSNPPTVRNLVMVLTYQ